MGISDFRGVYSCFFFLYCCRSFVYIFFFFNDTATTEIYTLSLHDALPISKLIHEAELSDPRLPQIAGESRGELGRGGMRTKLAAAQIAARSGAATVIAHGRAPDSLLKIAAGETIGTLLKPADAPMGARKRWIAGQLQLRGKLHVDDGAAKALKSGKSLLPVGVKKIEGNFARGDLVACIGAEGREAARGLSNYSAAHAQRLLGAKSEEIAARLGVACEPELIHHH